MRYVTSLLRKVDERQKDGFTEGLLPYMRRSGEALVEVLRGVPVSKHLSTDTLLMHEGEEDFLAFCGKV